MCCSILNRDILHNNMQAGESMTRLTKETHLVFHNPTYSMREDYTISQKLLDVTRCNKDENHFPSSALVHPS